MTKELLQMCQAEFEDYADLLKQFNSPVDSCIGGSMIRANSMADKLKQALAQQEPLTADQHFDLLDAALLFADKLNAVLDRDTKLIKAQQEQPANRVYLVATGEVHEGQETYTRHDTPPPLCDYETLFTQTKQEQPASVDAYVGAREDAAIWKKRALEAEELNRKFIAELNGPTYLGEPVKQEQPAQEPVAWLHGTTFQVVVSKNRPNSLAAWLPLFAHPAPTQPALSDDDLHRLWRKAETTISARSNVQIYGRLIEAHCRGGAS